MVKGDSRRRRPPWIKSIHRRQRNKMSARIMMVINMNFVRKTGRLVLNEVHCCMHTPCANVCHVVANPVYHETPRLCLLSAQTEPMSPIPCALAPPPFGEGSIAPAPPSLFAWLELAAICNGRQSSKRCQRPASVGGLYVNRCTTVSALRACQHHVQHERLAVVYIGCSVLV